MTADRRQELGELISDVIADVGDLKPQVVAYEVIESVLAHFANHPDPNERALGRAICNGVKLDELAPGEGIQNTTESFVHFLRICEEES